MPVYQYYRKRYLKDAFFMTLMKLRLDFLFTDLSQVSLGKR